MIITRESGDNLVVYLNGRRANVDDLYAFFTDYTKLGKQIVTYKFKAGRFIFLETRH